MKKINTKIMAEIAIFAAIGYILDFFQGAYSDLIFPFFTRGGSIGISMIAVFIITYRNGFKAGFITGLIIGLLDLLDGFYAYTDTWYKALIQISMDYIFAYALCAICVVMRKKFLKATTFTKEAIYITIGCVIGGLCKFMAHFISGVFFWPNEDASSKYLFSLGYNIAYIGPSIVLTIIVLVLIFKRTPQLLKGKIE